ncbi:hypothetical protein [Agromyces humi]|uniref:hypothetical protein n=1 Tax=Agromyces humi TaxID=1766800 RepID=UPI00135C8C56|nr:hypothetical protein [Agromyces humi]
MTDVTFRSRHLDGKFAAEPARPGPVLAPNLAVEPATGKVTVGTTLMKVGVTPGVLDDDADFAFKNGQCVAFAQAVVRHLDLEGVTVYYRTDEQTIIHAFATDGSRYFDVTGEVDIDEWEQDCFPDAGLEDDADDDLFDDGIGWDRYELDSDETLDINHGEWSNGLATQNFDLAATMMNAYEERLEAQRLAKDQADRETWSYLTDLRLGQPVR